MGRGCRGWRTAGSWFVAALVLLVVGNHKWGGTAVVVVAFAGASHVLAVVFHILDALLLLQHQRDCRGGIKAAMVAATGAVAPPKSGSMTNVNVVEKDTDNDFTGMPVDTLQFRLLSMDNHGIYLL